MNSNANMLKDLANSSVVWETSSNFSDAKKITINKVEFLPLLNFLVESNDISATRYEGSDTQATNNKALICRDISSIVSIIQLILQWHESMENFPPNGDIIKIMFCMLGNEQIQSGTIPYNEFEEMFDLAPAPTTVDAPAEQNVIINVEASTIQGNNRAQAQAEVHANTSKINMQNRIYIPIDHGYNPFQDNDIMQNIMTVINSRDIETSKLQFPSMKEDIRKALMIRFQAASNNLNTTLIKYKQFKTVSDTRDGVKTIANWFNQNHETRRRFTEFNTEMLNNANKLTSHAKGLMIKETFNYLTKGVAGNVVDYNRFDEVIQKGYKDEFNDNTADKNLVRKAIKKLDDVSDAIKIRSEDHSEIVNELFTNINDMINSIPDKVVKLTVNLVKTGHKNKASDNLDTKYKYHRRPSNTEGIR